MAETDERKGRLHRHRFAAAMSMLFVLLFTGCATVGARRQAERLQSELAVYRGTVVRAGTADRPVMVLLYDPATRSVVFYDLLMADREYYLLGKPGSYEVVAFEDTNRNFLFDGGEPWGRLNSPPVDTAADPEARGEVRLGDSHQAPAIDLSSTGLSSVLSRRNAALGRVVALDDPMFDDEHAAEGLWKPADFVREGRTGIYFLSAYDPARVPVLFVHGIGGSPRELQPVAQGLDPARFQPWFFHYPSGMSLDANGWLLEQMIEELRARLGFNRMLLIAHSMGGLVSASALHWRAREQQPALIDLVVTISTPWLGSAAAAKAPSGLSMPAWKDVVPGSDFIRALSDLPMIDTAEYCLLFSHAGDSRIMAGGDDGTVTISSQLPYEAQNKAAFIYGFEENHASILKNELAIAMISRITTNKLEGRPAGDGLRALAISWERDRAGKASQQVGDGGPH